MRETYPQCKIAMDRISHFIDFVSKAEEEYKKTGFDMAVVEANLEAADELLSAARNCFSTFLEDFIDK